MKKGMNEALERTLWKQEISLQDRLLADTPVGSDVSQGQAERAKREPGPGGQVAMDQLHFFT